jgi:beta-xylosidase
MKKSVAYIAFSIMFTVTFARACTNQSTVPPGSATAFSQGSAIATSTEPSTISASEISITPTKTETIVNNPSTNYVYKNPVFWGDFPDPFVLRVGDAYYAYATNAGDTNVQTLRSNDLINWEYLGDSLPRLPDWSAWHQSLTWAPSVLQRADAFVLYYTARFREADLQCISRASSDSPGGPFKDDSAKPFICQVDIGGSIDPSPFVDEDGKAYLLWKNDGNCCGKPVGIWIQQLSDDGLALVDQPIELIRKDQLWEHPLIEGPSMVKHNGKYYLFYSANWWESLDYAVGYAICDTLTGPCVKPLKKPLFAYKGTVMGPGGEEFFTDTKGNLWMAYHAWTAPNVGYPGGSRSLRIDRVTFEGDKPVINGPTDDPQPLP